MSTHIPETWIRQITEAVAERLREGSTSPAPQSAPGARSVPPGGSGYDDPAATVAGPSAAATGGAGPSACPCCASAGSCAGDCPDRFQQLVEYGVARLGCAPGIGPVDPALAGMLDHTLLKPEATDRQIAQLCEEAHCHGFATVCVQPIWVPLAARLLTGSRTRVCTVVGFPHGANRAEVKAYETQVAVAQGAREIDMVIPIGALKSGDLVEVERHIRAVVRAAIAGVVTKVILENTFLTDEEKRAACRIAKDVGATFVKTSTGFGPSGASLEDVRLMREVVGPRVGVKAAGGIRDTDAARAMVAAGATRIGASASVEIARAR